MLKRVQLILAVIGVVSVTMLGSPPATASTVTNVTVNATFTGLESAAGTATVDGVTGTYSGSWSTKFDGNGVPRAVVGTHTLAMPDGSITVRFSSRLLDVVSPVELTFAEYWSVRDADGAYAHWRGQGSGTTTIDLAAGPSLSTAIDMQLP